VRLRVCGTYLLQGSLEPCELLLYHEALFNPTE
jgi:hypothetical protein